MAKKTELRTAYEEALRKGLTSDSAAERTACIKAISDEENPNLGDLRVRLAQAEDRLTDAKNSLKEANDAKEELAKRLAELEPVAGKMTEVQSECDALRANRDADRAALRAELVSEAETKLRNAESAVQRATEITARAEAKFNVERLKKSVTAWQEQVAGNPMSPFFENPGHCSMYWESWAFFNETPGKAALWVSLESMASEQEAFRAFADRILHAQCRWCPNPTMIENQAMKQEFVLALADYLGIREELEAVNDVALRNHASWHAEQQVAAAVAIERQKALAGVGRVPIGSSEESSGLPLELHAPGCCCPSHGGIPRHLRTGEVVEHF